MKLINASLISEFAVTYINIIASWLLLATSGVESSVNGK